MKLRFQLHLIKHISAEHADCLWALMRENYDHVKKSVFLTDLNKKDYVGILRNEEDEIKGFTTFVVNPNNCGTDAYNVIFSGDTIICPSHWGTQEMIRGGMRTVGKIMATEPDKRWYWFLISKGHRTYMYLPIFFHHYYPAKDPFRSPAHYKEIVDHSASCMFGDAWKSEKGIIQFPEKQGQLKRELAEPSWKKGKNPNVAFFLEKNPNFSEGDELACLTELNPENVHIRMREEMIKGLQEPCYAH